MKIPLSWLREFVDVKEEPERLAEALTLVGLAVDGIDKAGGDVVLDLDVTTNRVDCMNVYGVAREVSVIYGRPLRPLELGGPEEGRTAAGGLRVTIDASELCPRFCARVLDVRLGPSPAFIRDRLEQVGVRPIHNVVDLTNYVMMEMGQPTHAFDLLRIPEGHLRVRWARPGERLTTLDGVERTLEPGMGVVAGPEAALALAGVMGGATSEVSEETTVVALEAAYWDPPAIRRTAKALGMHTEASHRFERGADPEAPARATARIAHLLGKLGAGQARPGLIDSRGHPLAPRRVRLRPARIDKVLGTAVPSERAEAILVGLGARVEASGGALQVEVPSWRGDLAREIDLVEEVARHHGLDKVPPTLPPATLPGGLSRGQARERRLRELLLGAGLTEAVNLGFLDGEKTKAFAKAPLALRNPLSADLDVLRGSLLPGLLGNLQTNLRQGARDLALFEIGRVFAPPRAGEILPREERCLGLVLTGLVRPPHWSRPPELFDFFAAKGLLEALAEGLAGSTVEMSEGDGLPGFLQPGRSAVVRGKAGALGFVGTLHAEQAAGLDVRGEVVLAEVSLESWLDAADVPLRVRPLDRFPAVSRDLSLLCDASLSAALILGRVREAAGGSLRGAEILDRYVGEPVPRGKVSLTVGMRFQDGTRTLTGDEVQEAVGRVTEALRRAGAEIRSQ